MTSSEQVLFEQLRDNFIAVHKAQEINKEMGALDRDMLKVSEDKIEEVCRKIARNVTQFIEDGKSRGRKPTTSQIVNKIREELNSQ